MITNETTAALMRRAAEIGATIDQAYLDDVYMDEIQEELLDAISSGDDLRAVVSKMNLFEQDVASAIIDLAKVDLQEGDILSKDSIAVATQKFLDLRTAYRAEASKDLSLHFEFEDGREIGPDDALTMTIDPDAVTFRIDSLEGLTHAECGAYPDGYGFRWWESFAREGGGKASIASIRSTFISALGYEAALLQVDEDDVDAATCMDSTADALEDGWWLKRDTEVSYEEISKDLPANNYDAIRAA